MPKQFTLGKNERLKGRKLIEQLFKEGKSFNSFPFRVYYLAEMIISNQHSSGSHQSHVQFGIGVSSKNFKKAVDRNKIKRWVRETWRLQRNVLTDLLNKENKHLSVFFIYTQKDLPDYKTIYAKTGLIVNKLAKLVHETYSPNT